MIEAERTEGSAYDTLMSYAEDGLVPACVPVSLNGEQHIWSQAAKFDPEMLQDDLDTIALAILAISKAYKTASKYGLIPVL
jgi:hypothetical protein